MSGGGQDPSGLDVRGMTRKPRREGSGRRGRRPPGRAACSAPLRVLSGGCRCGLPIATPSLMPSLLEQMSGGLQVVGSHGA